MLCPARCLWPGQSTICDVWLISLTRFWRFLHRSMNAQMASELIGAQTHIQFDNHVVLNLTSCDFVFSLLNHDSESTIVTIWYGAVRCHHRRNWRNDGSCFFAGRQLRGARPPASRDLAMDGLRVVCRTVTCRLPASYLVIYNLFGFELTASWFILIILLQSQWTFKLDWLLWNRAFGMVLKRYLHPSSKMFHGS